ncbi:hypothetical protein CDD83_2932 [Cordyceps sp. RAO-2017]|nr:hypothetical protein CDD83_2932 [Cordyceps sp. RAO-2017]
MAGLVPPASSYGPHAASIVAGHDRLDALGDDGLATVDNRTPSPVSSALGILYHPIFQHQIHMSLAGQHIHDYSRPPPLQPQPHQALDHLTTAAGAGFYYGGLPAQTLSPGHVGGGTGSGVDDGFDNGNGLGGGADYGFDYAVGIDYAIGHGDSSQASSGSSNTSDASDASNSSGGSSNTTSSNNSGGSGTADSTGPCVTDRVYEATHATPSDALALAQAFAVEPDGALLHKSAPGAPPPPSANPISSRSLSFSPWSGRGYYYPDSQGQWDPAARLTRLQQHHHYPQQQRQQQQQPPPHHHYHQQLPGPPARPIMGGGHSYPHGGCSQETISPPSAGQSCPDARGVEQTPSAQHDAGSLEVVLSEPRKCPAAPDHATKGQGAGEDATAEGMTTNREVEPATMADRITNREAPTEEALTEQAAAETASSSDHTPPGRTDDLNLRHIAITLATPESGYICSFQVNEGRPAKKRGPFDEARRKETADTRGRKACLRCRVQKLRCCPDPENPQAPCQACQHFSKTSKKTIHHGPCYRGKLTDTVLFRKGGLNLTDRWDGTTMRNVGDRLNDDFRTIKVTIGVCTEPVVIEVVAFAPRPNDVTARFWYTREGEDGTEVRKRKDLEVYCLRDIWKTAEYFEKYVIDNAIPSFVRINSAATQYHGVSLLSHDVLKQTYSKAVEHYFSLLQEEVAGETKIEKLEKRLLRHLFILWFSTRHTTGSSFICGEEKLGMKPETKDETYPLYNKVSVPRMIVAQFDSINHTRLLNKYGKEVLKDLENLIFRNDGSCWWTIYLCVFILLREASFISADRYRHARNNHGAKYRYSIPQFVEELQEGCNNILMHWHYYNCKGWPDPAEPWSRHKTFLSDLTSEQYDLVMETMTDPRVQRQLSVWRRYKEDNGFVENVAAPARDDHQTAYTGTQTQFDWDYPLYWVAQMFEEKWQPHPTYRGETIE